MTVLGLGNDDEDVVAVTSVVEGQTDEQSVEKSWK